MPEVSALADITEESSFDTPDLHDFIAARTADNECHLAETTVEQPKTSFSYIADGILVRGLPADGGTQQYVPAVMRPCVMHLYHNLLIMGYPGER